ncbi:MAG: glycosyltransferase, partial [Deltaproteobacteria bacterium]|nr:glycosyltransferase [Deltaproteobacteria bacterium]
NNIPDTEEHFNRDTLERMQAQSSFAVTCPTRSVADLVKSRWGIGDIQVIPNLFSLKTYTPDLSVYEQHLRGIEYILFFGRLERLKGALVLAEAIPEILDRHRDIHMVFVGNESVYNSESMKACIAKPLQGYEARVHFIGTIPHSALYPIIERARLVALPSLWENFPYVCLEAMALGKPLVTTSAGGLPEVIEDGKQGILCAPGDVSALKHGIVRCLEKTDMELMGNNAKIKAQTYDTEKVAKDMLEFYEGIACRDRTNKLKIAYLLRHIPVSSETFVINEIIAMQSLDMDVHPIALLPAEKCHEGLMSKIQNPILDLSSDEARQGAAHSPFYATAVQIAADLGLPAVSAEQAVLVAEYLKENNIGLMHAHFATESAWVAMMASRLTGVPFSFTAHAYDIFMRNKAIINEDGPERRVRILVENAYRVYTVSEFNKEYILSMTDRKFADKIHVVHCGIDPDRFKPVARRASETIVFLSVGRFVEKKGHEFLLRSFKEAAKTLGNVQLRIVGEGHLRDGLMHLSEEIGIADKIVFMGVLSSQRVVEEMQKADIFVLHSVTGADGDREGIPVSIMEASASGLPVVSTRHSGIPELVIEGATGLLSAERDIEGFSNHMIALASSCDLRERMGAAGRKYAAERFNLRKEAQKLRDGFIDIYGIPELQRRGAGSNLVDIIMPTYNPDVALIRRAVQSIMDQTFKDWRLFIVKDGGEADVQGLLKGFNDPRINFYEIPHKGKGRALNLAISKGNAKYIAYLDDDDIWYPFHLETAVSCMAKNNVRFLHTDCYEVFVTREGEGMREVSRRSLNKGPITDITMWYISHINAVHERSLLDEAGGYDEGRRFFIDWDMFLRMAKYTKPYHLRVVTCEHYMYLDRHEIESNIISGILRKDPELASRALSEMFVRSFELMSPKDFADFVEDWQAKVLAIERKDKEFRKQMQDLYNSLSWRVTRPLRWFYELVAQGKTK